MHRSTARSLTVVAVAGLLAVASLPAQAKSSRPKQHRGKKAIGEIVSFDEATMTLDVDLPGEEDFSGPVDPDVQVKLDHRGWNEKGRSHGNPARGSLDDLVPGALVLRMKVEDDLVTKIRLRPAEEAPPAEDGNEDEDALPGDGSPGDDTSDDPGDDSSDSGDDTSDSGDDPDENTSGDDSDLSDEDSESED